ncbi:hypothetical protein [Planomonospora sp. ID82291]|uniref:hypothetical protein n=1 Tax=Planomonospora sp. ID82291 TaxID=2738136 RepID=UPI0018C41EA2|nr:hypothetical protein [Planomonospora sp. ID82291]MBG0814327.1 hypothetical protein [Planomonospora sp. ID82291]
MGCAVCGHPPYDHGCLHAEAHAYRVPSAEQVAARWELIRAARLDELRMPARDWVRPAECLPALAPRPTGRESVPAGPFIERRYVTTGQPAERTPAVPAPRTVEPVPGKALPALGSSWPIVPAEMRRTADRPVEARETRTLRLSLAREPLVLRRARAVAARERLPRSTTGIGHLVPGGPPPGAAVRSRPGELAVHHTASRSPYSPGSARRRTPTPVETAA